MHIICKHIDEIFHSEFCFRPQSVEISKLSTFFTHNVPVDIPVFIVHSKRVLLRLLGPLLDLVVLGSKLTDDPHSVLRGSTPPLTKLCLPLVTMTLLLQ